MTTDEFLATRRVFSLAEAREALRPARGSLGTVERLKHYLETGRLQLVTRGVYATVPPGEDANRFSPDPFLVAATVRGDALFSHHAALELLGVAHSTWRGVSVWTARRRSRLAVGRHELVFLEHPSVLRDRGKVDLGVRRVEWRGRVLVATGPERTLVEGFRKPRLAGGVEELVTSAAGFAVLDLDQLQEVLDVYDTRYLWAAVGWFTETFQRTFHVPGAFLDRCEAERPASPHYLVRGSRGGEFQRRWNLVLPRVLTAIEPDEPLD